MSVPLDDRGLLLGDGLFETLLWKDGALVLGEAHLARMVAGAAALGLPAPDAAAFLSLAAQAVAEAELDAARAAVRVTYTAGSGGRGLDRPAAPAPRLFATAAPSRPPTTPARLVVAEIRRNEISPASRFKTLSYLESVLARREAIAAGADEAAMLNTRGEVACAAAANLFWIAGDALVTPSADTGRLDGIMAGAVTAAARRLGVAVREVRVGPDVLAAAQALFLTNSLTGVRPAHMLGVAFAPHRLVEQLAAAVADVS